MTAQQAEAQRLAAMLRKDKLMFINSVAAEYEAAAKLLEHQHARIAELEAQQEFKPLTDGDIVAAQEKLIAAKDDLYRSRIGQQCSRCSAGKYRADGNGYHDFHRCDNCRHVPMWNPDGTEFAPPKPNQQERWLCLLCKSSRPGHHGFLDDLTTPCPNKGKT